MIRDAGTCAALHCGRETGSWRDRPVTTLLMVIIFVTTGASVVSLLSFAKSIGHRFDILDRPGERKMHTGSIPRTGGVAMFGGLAIGGVVVFLLAVFNDITAQERRLFLTLGLALLLIFASGFLDDMRNLGIKSRLAVQLAASCLVFFGGGIGGDLVAFFAVPFRENAIELPTAISLLLVVIWLAGMTNAINWIDGIDGLAGSTGAVIFLVYFLISVVQNDAYAALLSVAALAMCVSFFGVNYPPADIFMGDGGSYIVGFLMGWVSLRLYSGATPSGDFWLSLFLLVPCALPVLDMIRVASNRMRGGNSPTTADRTHLHHILVDRYRPARALAILAMINLIIGLGSLLVVWLLGQ